MKRFSILRALGVDQPQQRKISVGILVCAVLLLTALLLLLLISSILDVWRAPLLRVLHVAEYWAALIANSIVIFYAFPTFKRTRNRAFLYLGLAALSSAYGVIFTLLFGIGPPFSAAHWSRSDLHFYYAIRYIVYIVGVGLYARGIMLLARDARSRT
jgi:hypothetical protein